jgi:hypothetical protein
LKKELRDAIRKRSTGARSSKEEYVNYIRRFREGLANEINHNFGSKLAQLDDPDCFVVLTKPKGL